MSERLCVVGAGRSGAVTAACLADLGHSVCAVDINATLVAKLQEGRAPFYEPDLDDVIQRNLKAGRLSFTTAFSEGVPDADFVVLCVGTPPQTNGEADLTALHAAIGEVAPLLRENAVVITRSTVPVGTNASLAEKIRAERPQTAFEIVSNPEFLREGHAVQDFVGPERIVIGANSERGRKAAARLYQDIDCPIVFADLETAEMIKYAANAYLATSISFINEIANICERVGADVSLVREALMLDRRIGPHAYLTPGIGFGGSCLPKDLHALVAAAEGHGYRPTMLRAVVQVNELQPRWVIGCLEQIFTELPGLTVAVFGISFKADTFDPRSSPAVAVIRLLANEGVHVRAFDPLADATAGEQLQGLAELSSDAYSAATGCHALVFVTAHRQFRELDLERLRRTMKSPVLIDGQNLFEPDTVSRAGFSYIGIGRPRRND